MGYFNLEQNTILHIFILSKINILFDSNERILTNYLIYICIHLYFIKFSIHIYNSYIKETNLEIVKEPNLEIVKETDLEIVKETNLEIVKETDLCKSKILKCKIVNKENKIISFAIKYRKILIDIWKSENNKEDIINKNKLFKFLDAEETDKTYYNYCKEIDLWFRNCDSNKSFKQILLNIKKNDYKIDISIKLNNDRIINYNNY